MKVFTGGNTGEQTDNGLIRLVTGERYEIADMEFAGWYVGDNPATNPAGYAVEHYFADGLYLGPDCDGVEPLFQ